MSEAAHVPFTETKAPESAERLHRGALGLVDISASTMANIGPAYSFYFAFAGIVIAAGLASPLVVLVAAVAIALLGNTLSQFSRAHPSTGGFITFVGKTFGGTSAVTTALVAGAGYIIAISSVLVISGGFLSIMLQFYFNVSIPWIIFSAVFTAGAKPKITPATMEANKVKMRTRPSRPTSCARGKVSGSVRSAA